MRRRFIIACAFSIAAMTGESAAASTCNPRLFIANRSTTEGSLATMCAASPWAVQTELAPLPSSPLLTDDHVVRVFGDRVYVVSQYAGTIDVFGTGNAALIATYDLGANSSPMDIAVIDPQTAYITRTNATHLLRLDLQTGVTQTVADLTVFSDDLMPEMSMMILDAQTNRLFVQIQSTSVLAVFDVATQTLVDVDPNSPGTQPIVLQGILPRYKMQIDQTLRRLYVSATGGYFSSMGGIEMIDLDTLTSLGFALEKKDFGVPDIGAFIIVSETRGYFVFHTDIAPSSHLNGFTIGEGPDSGSLIDVLGWPWTVALEFDPVTGHVYMPHGGEQTSGPFVPGVYVIDAATGDVRTNQPVDVGGWPADLALAGRCPWDLNADGVVNVFDLLALLSAWGPAGSFNPADLNHDGTVNVFDLLELLAAWGPCPT